MINIVKLRVSLSILLIWLVHGSHRVSHDLDVIKNADYVIGMGPGGGAEGGEIVATGTPGQISECERSKTRIFLKL